MGLVFWLPLNGNLINYGTEQLKITTKRSTAPTFSNDGIITQNCLTLGNNAITNTHTINSLVNKKAFTVSFWLKQSTIYTAIKASDILTMYTYSGSAVIPLSFNITKGTSAPLRVANSLNVTNYSLMYDEGWTTSTGFFQPYPLDTLGNWHHIVFVFTATACTEFIDGVRINTATKLNQNYKLNGEISISSTNISGYLNDLKIYDYALSLTEVKNLSLGLNLYYDCEDESFDSYDKSLADNSGYLNLGYYGTHSTTSITAPLGKTCLYLPGNANAIIHTADIGYNNIKSVSFWIKTYNSAAPTSNQVVFVTGNNNIAGFGFFGNTGFIVSTAISMSVFPYTADFKWGSWNHIVLTYITSTTAPSVELYINNNKQSPYSSKYDYWDHSANDLTIGGRLKTDESTYSATFLGYISNFKTFSRRLTSDQINDLYITRTTIDAIGNISSTLAIEDDQTTSIGSANGLLINKTFTETITTDESPSISASATSTATQVNTLIEK